MARETAHQPAKGLQAKRVATVAVPSASSFQRRQAIRPRVGKRVVLPLVGFAATFAFVSASLVNPLSGAYAATPTATPTDQAGASYTVAGQTYTVADGSTTSATRDAYTVNYTPPVVKKPKVVATTKAAVSATTTATTNPAPAVQSAPAAPAPTPGSAQAVGAQLVAARGWDTSQFNCLVSLWNRESGWNVYASNASSGAYGIPQALPGSKMASVGADWQTNPATQITWGLNYIQGRYVNPCGAWAHSQANGWY